MTVMNKMEAAADMKNIKLVLILIITVSLVSVFFQNTGNMEAHFLWMTAEVPVIIVFFSTLAAGFFLGLFTALFLRRGKKQKQKKKDIPVIEN